MYTHQTFPFPPCAKVTKIYLYIKLYHFGFFLFDRSNHIKNHSHNLCQCWHTFDVMAKYVKQIRKLKSSEFHRRAQMKLFPVWWVNVTSGSNLLKFADLKFKFWRKNKPILKPDNWKLKLYVHLISGTLVVFFVKFESWNPRMQLNPNHLFFNQLMFPMKY